MNTLRILLNRLPRERRLILAGIGVIALVILAQTFFAGYQQRERLRRQVLVLERQLAQIRVDADELTRLQAGSPNRKRIGGDELEKWLRQEAVQIGEMKLTLIGPRRASIKGEVDFERWIDWAARIHGEQGIRIISADLKPSSLPGRVFLTADIAGTDIQ